MNFIFIYNTGSIFDQLNSVMNLLVNCSCKGEQSDSEHYLKLLKLLVCADCV